jgi:hypothetical protein
MRRLPIGSCLRDAALVSTVGAARTLVAQSPFEGTIAMCVTSDYGAPSDGWQKLGGFPGGGPR